nr:uncharacterized protein LOC117273497 [Nicotiana tomentosiformis]
MKVQALLARFQELSITHIPREENVEEDTLANLGSSMKIKGLDSGTVVQLMHSVLDADSYYEIWDTKRNSLRQRATIYRRKITKFLEDLKIKRITSSPYRPSANSQEESTNKVIIQNLRKRLEVAKGKWPGELPDVLWAYRTTAKSSTGETPFSLVYGAEALIPVEVGEPTMRYFRSNEKANNESILVNLELLDKRRDLELNAGKLGPTWEGPYRISAVTGKGSYELESQDGEKFPSN